MLFTTVEQDTCSLEQERFESFALGGRHSWRFFRYRRPHSSCNARHYHYGNSPCCRLVYSLHNVYHYRIQFHPHLIHADIFRFIILWTRYSTFCYLAGVDPEDPNTIHTASDGSKYPMPGTRHNCLTTASMYADYLPDL